MSARTALYNIYSSGDEVFELAAEVPGMFDHAVRLNWGGGEDGQPLGPDEIEKWGGVLRVADPGSKFAVADATLSTGPSRLKRTWLYAAGGFAALAVAASGFWLFKRRKATRA